MRGGSGRARQSVVCAAILDCSLECVFSVVFCSAINLNHLKYTFHLISVSHSHALAMLSLIAECNQAGQYTEWHTPMGQDVV